MRKLSLKLKILKNTLALEELAIKEHYYYSCGMRQSLENFVKTQSEVYRRFIDRRHELKAKQEKTSYNGYIIKNFDMNKVYMDTMHEYLKICEGSNNKELIKFYIGLIERYLESDKDKSVSITTDENINRLKRCALEVGHDVDKIVNHDDFIKLCRNKFNIKNKRF